MGGVKYDPTFWEAVPIQILCILALPFVPILWIIALALLLYSLCSWNPADVRESAQAIALFSLIPFILTFGHLVALCKGVYHLLPRIRREVCIELMGKGVTS